LGGDGAFLSWKHEPGERMYEMAQSTAHESFTVWQMAWHGGIALHGENTPPQGITNWWCFTRPTDELLEG
jgi:hypothetical protein